MKFLVPAVKPIVAVASLCLLFAGTAVPATAVEPQPTQYYYPAEAETIDRAFLEQFGVAAADIDRLVEVNKTGGTWDALSGAVPVVTEPAGNVNGIPSTLERYADGSISISGKEEPAVVPPGSFSTLHVGGCTSGAVSGGKKYYDCEVYTWVGTWSLSFTADYTIKTSGNDSINRVDDEAVSMTGWSVDKEKLVITRATENSVAKATARYSVTRSQNIAGYPIRVESKWIQLNVGANKATETHS